MRYKRQKFNFTTRLSIQGINPNGSSSATVSKTYSVPFQGRSDVLVESVTTHATLFSPNSGGDKDAITKKVQVVLFGPGAGGGGYSKANYPVFDEAGFIDGIQQILPTALYLFGGFNFTHYQIQSPKLLIQASVGSRDILNIYNNDALLTSIDLSFFISMTISYLKR